MFGDPTQVSHWIIEGIDRLGKSTLIKNIRNTFGFHMIYHYEKPQELQYYKKEDNTYNVKEYQKHSFMAGFKILETSAKTIYDRFHLGECVYSPLYRGYSGDYVFDEIERHFSSQWPNLPETRRMTPKIVDHTRLVLLTTSDFSILEDDGMCFDFDKKEEEQSLFIKAFERSLLSYKKIIDVSDGKGNYRQPKDIFEEIISGQ